MVSFLQSTNVFDVLLRVSVLHLFWMIIFAGWTGSQPWVCRNETGYSGIVLAEFFFKGLILGPVKCAFVSITHCLFPAECFRALFEVNSFRRMPGDAIEEGRQGLGRGDPHVFQCLVDH